MHDKGHLSLYAQPYDNPDIVKTNKQIRDNGRSACWVTPLPEAIGQGELMGAMHAGQTSLQTTPRRLLIGGNKDGAVNDE